MKGRVPSAERATPPARGMLAVKDVLGVREDTDPVYSERQTSVRRRKRGLMTVIGEEDMKCRGDGMR